MLICRRFDTGDGVCRQDAPDGILLVDTLHPLEAPHIELPGLVLFTAHKGDQLRPGMQKLCLETCRWFWVPYFPGWVIIIRSTNKFAIF